MPHPVSVQEPAIKSLKAAIIRERPGEDNADRDIRTEEAPVGESQSNGYIERRTKTVQGMIRTMRGALEARLGRRLDSTSDITPWLVKHAAHTLGRYSKGTDGRTPHARLSGINFNNTVCKFGERVLYVIPQKHHQQLHCQGTYEDQWEYGVWLGIIPETTEVIIGTTKGVLKARSIKRLAKEEARWNASYVADMKGTPWEPVPGRAG